MRRSSVHSPQASRERESALERVRRISREHNKPFDPTKRGTWHGSSKDLVVNPTARRGDKHGQELIEGEEGFIVIETEPHDRHPYILVNPLDFEMNNLYGLHFGAYGWTKLLVWSRHLENALEPAAEWLEKYAPGLLTSEQEIGRLMEEVREEHPGISDEEAYEEATTGLTYTEAGWITSHEWGVSFDSEAASEEDELFVAALEASKEEYAEVWPDNDVPVRNGRRAHRKNARLNAFQRGFLTAALWSSTDESDDSGGEPLDKNYSIEDIAPETLASLLKDCDDFSEANAELLARAGDDEQNGHDFWLTRNGHGAGFWDRGYGAVGDKLSDACKPYGSVDLYVGDDGMIHGS
jgi:hypothetical protein